MNDHVYSFLLFVSSKPHYHAEFKCIVSVLLAESPKRIHRACSENRTRPEVAILVLTKRSSASDNQKQLPTWTACCRHEFSKILILHMFKDALERFSALIFSGVAWTEDKYFSGVEFSSL